MNTTLLTTEQLADRLQVNVITIRRWIKSGTLHAIKLPGRAGWRIPLAEVERVLRGE